MSKIAVVNVNSFAKRYPEHVTELEMKIGKVDRFKVDEHIDSIELANMLQGYQYIILGTTPPITEEFFEHQKDVRLITRHGIGYNHIDLEAARNHNVFVCKELGIIERDAVAEQAVCLLGTVAKRIDQGNWMVHNKEWSIRRERVMGYQMSNKTTGIIGYGNIGSRFAEIMKFGFRNRILAYDPFLTQEQADSYNIEKVSLEELLKESDFISIHANYTEEAHNLINEQTLKLMKPEAILINTARGKFIDENALACALRKRHLAGFGADVMVEEPMLDDHPLLECEYAVFTPHVGVYNEICLRNMDLKVMDDIYLVEDGQRPLEIVNGL
ncbi:NAD(P)-dependent oxidoreductase [Amedibacillus sp. YH-ame10]